MKSPAHSPRHTTLSFVIFSFLCHLATVDCIGSSNVAHARMTRAYKPTKLDSASDIMNIRTAHLFAGTIFCRLEKNRLLLLKA